MISTLPRYTQLQAIPSPFVPQVPQHWGFQPLKQLANVQLSNVDKLSGEGEQPVFLCNYVDVYKHDFIHSGHSFMPATAKPNEIDRFELRRGDVLITKDSETWDDIGVPALIVEDLPGVLCGYHLALLRPRPSLLDGAYLYWALESQPTALQFHVAATGVTRYGISKADIKNVSIPLPPLSEQTAIARFLTNAQRIINRLIRNKRRLIALLNEEKQAIIQQAVTRGLDPDVPMKPSGVEWLGEIPAHWFFGHLRRYWDIADCKHLTVPFVDEGIPLASVSEVRGFDLNLTRAKRTTKVWYEHLVAGNRKPRRGDLVYCRNVSVGSCAFVNIDEDFALGQDVCLIRSRDQNQRFLNYLLHSPFMEYQLAKLLVGSTFKRINISQILALQVLVPPRAEQDEIVARLDDWVSEVDETVGRIEQEIDLIREYRARLVADVVTGQFDVREAASLSEVEEVDINAAIAEAHGLEDFGDAIDDEPVATVENVDAAD